VRIPLSICWICMHMQTCLFTSFLFLDKLSWDTIKSNYKDAATDEHNGTIACVVISAFFAFVSLLVVFCNKKCGVIVLTLIAGMWIFRVTLVVSSEYYILIFILLLFLNI
jgi:hypothetical protein